ncbi:MAG: hypothetical protein ACFFAN_12060 [Promethearchaeota archaeon]
MSKGELKFPTNDRKFERSFSWNGCDDQLKKRIDNSTFVESIRNKLMKKSMEKKRNTYL